MRANWRPQICALWVSVVLLPYSGTADAQTTSDAGSVYQDPTFDLYTQGVYPRLDIRRFETDPTLWRQRSLLLLAWQRMQQRDPSDPYSAAQLSKVHGMPYGPYAGVQSMVWDPVKANQTMWWPGHCQHGNTLVGPWHRAYLLTFERGLRTAALEVVNERWSFDQLLWRNAAMQLRLPRWDFADPLNLVLGPSTLLTREMVDVVVPGSGVRIINNPLYSFTIPWRPNDPALCVVPGGCVGLSFAPDKRLTPFMPWAKSTDQPPMNLPAGSKTVRWPRGKAPDLQSSDLIVDLALRALAVPAAMIQSASLTTDNWHCFWIGQTGYGERPVGVKCPLTSFVSFNDVHGLVHGALGGISASLKMGGHAAPTETSAYEPLFFLLHSQVDFVMQLHIDLHNSYVLPGVNPYGTFYEVPGTLLDENTPLPPFRKPGTRGFFTAADLRTTEPFGYTYGPIDQAKRFSARRGSPLSNAVRGIFSALYNATASYQGYHWVATWDAFPLGQLMAAGLPSNQFFMFATVGAPVLTELLQGLRMPLNLCGVAFNFDGMVSPAAGANTTVVVSACLKAAAVANVLPRNRANPDDGPIGAPGFLQNLRFALIGMDGQDYSSLLTLPPPTIRWVLDSTSSGGSVATGTL